MLVASPRTDERRHESPSLATYIVRVFKIWKDRDTVKHMVVGFEEEEGWEAWYRATTPTVRSTSQSGNDFRARCLALLIRPIDSLVS